MDDSYVNQKIIYGLNNLINETIAGLKNLDQQFGFTATVPLKVYFNYHNIADLFKTLANDYVDNFSIYAKGYEKGKERLPQNHPNFDLLLERLLPACNCPTVEQYQALREYVLLYVFADVFDRIHGFVASIIVEPTWQVWTVDLIGSSLMLSRGQDFRVMEYYRLIEKYEPNTQNETIEDLPKPEVTIYEKYPNISSGVIRTVISLLGDIQAEMWLQSVICRRHYAFYPTFAPEDLDLLKRASKLKRNEFLVNFGYGWENNQQ